jgi:hypothetical protein
MKHLRKTFFASALVMAVLATTYAQAGGRAGMTVAPGVGAGSLKPPNERGYGSAGVTDTGVGAARSNRTAGRSISGKTNGLNKGTHSGANSDVNSGINGSRRNGE